MLAGPSALVRPQNRVRANVKNKRFETTSSSWNRPAPQWRMCPIVMRPRLFWMHSCLKRANSDRASSLSLRSTPISDTACSGLRPRSRRYQL
eukprot:1421390-Pyramimonas_sp.AAC.1